MLIPLPPGSPFPEISSTHTDIWVDFWNVVWKSWVEDAASGTGTSDGVAFRFYEERSYHRNRE